MLKPLLLKYKLSLWALLMLIAVPAGVFADDYPFARAFMTEEQREYLDRNRELLLDKFNLSADSLSESEIRLEDKADRFVLSGVVVREDGKNMVWVNGKSEISKKAHRYVENTHLIKRELGNEKVRLIYEDKYRTLKPGQVWLVDEGLVKELHEVTGEDKDQPKISESIKQIQELQKLAH